MPQLMIILFLALASPTTVVDSLEAELPGLQGQARTEALVQLAEYNCRLDREMSLQNIAEAVSTLDFYAAGNLRAGYQQRLGEVYSRLGLYEESRDLLEAAHLQYEQFGNFEDRGHNLNALGIVRSRLGERGPALQAFLSSYNLTMEYGDSLLIARSLNNLGLITKQLGDNNQAIIYFQRSLEIKRAMRDSGGIAKTLNNIGSLEQSNGQLDMAMVAYIESLGIKQGADNWESQAVTNGNLAQLCILLERYPEAMQYVRQEIVLLKKLGDQSGSLHGHLDMADVLTRMGKFDSAEQIYRKVVATARESGDKTLQARSLTTYGSLLLIQEKLKPALAAFEESYQIFAGMAELVQQARTGWQAGDVLLRLGRYAEARRYLTSSIEQAQVSDDLDLAQSAAMTLSRVQEKDGLAAQALKYRRLSAALGDSLQQRAGRARAEEMLLAFEAQQLHDKMGRMSTEAKLADLELARIGQKRTFLLASALFLLVASLLVGLQMRKAQIMQKAIKTQNLELATTLARIKDLSDCMPLCSYCHKIRDDEGFWLDVATFVETQTAATLQLSICPGCGSKENP